MLVTLKEITRDAMNSDYIVPAFNVYGFEDAKAVIQAAEELKKPVILATNRDAIGYMGIKNLAVLLINMAHESSEKICIHLDHGKKKEEIVAALEAGYPSVMFDGSSLEFDENLKITKEIVEIAKRYGASVEAEIGSVGYSDQGIDGELTDIDEAKRFQKESGVDLLAVSVGTLHRMTNRDAKINYERLSEIKKIVDIPLVIHGSTGLSDYHLAKLKNKEFKIGKINIGTALRMEFTSSLKKELIDNEKEMDRTKYFKKPMDDIKSLVIEKFKILGN